MIYLNSDLFKAVGSLSGRKMSRADLAPIVEQYANRYGINSALVYAVIGTESRGYTAARSSVGATGLMQIMPDTAKGLGFSPEQMLDPNHNIHAGVKYLSRLMKRATRKGISDPQTYALLSYSHGPGKVNSTYTRRYGTDVSKWPLKGSYRRYRDAVLKRMGKAPGATLNARTPMSPDKAKLQEVKARARNMPDAKWRGTRSRSNKNEWEEVTYDTGLRPRETSDKGLGPEDASKNIPTEAERKIRLVKPESLKRPDERFVRADDGKPILFRRPKPYTPRDSTTGVERRPTRVAGTLRRAPRARTSTASTPGRDPYPDDVKVNFTEREVSPDHIIEVDKPLRAIRDSSLDNLDKYGSKSSKLRGLKLGSKLKRRAPEQAKVDRWRYKSPGEAIAAKQRGASLVGTAYEKHPAVLRAPDKPTSGAPGALKVDRYKQKKISSEPSGAPGALKTDNFKYKSKGQRLAATQKVQPTVDRWKYKSPGQAAAAAKTRGADLTGTAYEKSPSVSQFRSATPRKKAVAKSLPAGNTVAKSVEAFMPISKNKAGV